MAIGSIKVDVRFKRHRLATFAGALMSIGAQRLGIWIISKFCVEVGPARWRTN